MTSNFRKLALAACMAAGLFGAAAQAAAPWPTRPLRIINPYAPGGPSDNIVRILAEGVGAELGQSVIVESKPGGGTAIGANFVAHAPADGYTLLLGTVAPLIVQPAINKALPYNVAKDFTPVGMFATVPNLISVNPSVPVKTLAEMIAYAKANPGKLNYASAGMGTGPHLGGELFSQMAGVKLTHVPYAGAAPAVVAVLGDQVQVSFVNITPQIQHVKAGKLRPLAIGSGRRSSVFPEIPTVQESGLANYVSESWNGLIAPAGTPKAVIDRIYAAVQVTMQKSAAQGAVSTLGGEITLLNPADFAAYMKADEARQVPIIRSLNLQPN
jgi:tripartite-type tricarboxylate transporter receptor subunit TctC